MDDYETTIHNFQFELVRATEQTALKAGRWSGLGNRAKADEAATGMMIRMLDQIHMNGHMLDSEARKAGTHSDLDDRPRVGTGEGPEMDIIADAIDGAGLLAEGRAGAISVVCAGPRGTLFCPNPALYMEKIVVDRTVAHVLAPECMEAPPAWTLALIARAKHKSVRDLVVFVLDRPRHYSLIDDIRQAGARAQIHHDGDVAGALLAATHNSRVDVLMGIGGALEGVIAAAAVKAMGGAILARVSPQSEAEHQAVREVGMDIHHILTANELVQGNEVFFAATGVTDGMLLPGINFLGQRAETHSLVIRGKSGVRRMIHTEHVLDPEEDGVPI